MLQGKYRMVREIARSNDIVYEAMDMKLQRRLAIKELNIAPGMTGQARRERIERFGREARAAGKLTHPNIVHVYEHWEENGRFFIAMEFLEGQSLGGMLKARGALSLKEAVNIACQTLDALTHAHQNRVIHRDIKPDNIHILPGGTVKLTDFGIARLTEEAALTSNGQIFGTPSYMSPEQIEGKSIDYRSDLFSLGVLLYEMLAGRKPFVGDSVISITYAIMNAEPAPLAGVPTALQEVVWRALAKRPEQRYANAEQMKRELRMAEQAPATYVSPQQSNAYLYPTGMGTAPMPYAGGPGQQPYGGAPMPLPYPANALPSYGNNSAPAHNQNTVYNMPPVNGTPNAAPQPWPWNSKNGGPGQTVMQPAQLSNYQPSNYQPSNYQQANYQPSAYQQSNYSQTPPFYQQPPNPAFAQTPPKVPISSGLPTWAIALISAVVIGLVVAFGIIGANKRYQGYQSEVKAANANALMNQGYTAYNNQDYANAANLFEKALAAGPAEQDRGNLLSNLTYTYTQLARAAKAQNNIEEAKKFYEKALGYQPGYKEANQELAEIKESQHDPSAGLNRMTAEKSTLDAPPPANIAAPSVAQSGNSYASSEIANRPAGNPNDYLDSRRQEAQKYLQAGDDAYNRNNIPEARKQWQAARDAAPGTGEYDQAIQRLNRTESAGGGGFGG